MQKTKLSLLWIVGGVMVLLRAVLSFTDPDIIVVNNIFKSVYAIGLGLIMAALMLSKNRNIILTVFCSLVVVVVSLLTVIFSDFIANLPLYETSAMMYMALFYILPPLLAFVIAVVAYKRFKTERWVHALGISYIIVAVAGTIVACVGNLFISFPEYEAIVDFSRGFGMVMDVASKLLAGGMIICIGKNK